MSSQEITRRWKVMLEDKQIQILMSMHELEKSMGDLYSLFLDKFPDSGELWKLLSREEQGHAKAIQTLYQASYDGKTVFEEGSIKAEAVQSVIDYVKEIRDQTMRGKLPLIRALTITYDLENSMLEKTVFEHFKGTSEFIGMMQTLRRETQKHALLAKKEIDKFKQANKL